MIVRRFAAAGLAALMLALAGCGANGGPAVTAEDKQLGARQHPHLLAEFGGAYAGEEAGYVSRVGAKVAKAAALDGQCRFTLVNTDVVNAFAVPGCYVYVTRGLLAIVGSEAELASVLAHEVGHITGNHSQRQQRSALWRQLGVIAVGILSDSPRLAALAGKAAGLFDLRYSREHEYEADTLGIGYMRAAGYDPNASATMLAALQRNSEFQARERGEDDARRIPEWALTHPLTENRIARVRAAVARTGIKPGSLPDGRAEYMREVDGLLFGDDPEQGFILGRRFEHPRMRIAFTAPPGFALTNSPRAVLIDGPDGMRGEFAGGPLPPGGLREYADGLLRAVLGNARAQVVRAQSVTVNGVEALIVEARVASPRGTASLALAVYRGGQGQAYHFLMLSEANRTANAGVEQLFGSFRLLTEAQARALRPRYIRVVAAAPGDTARSLAEGMAAASKLPTFLMLNGRDTATGIRAGEQVKVIAVGMPPPGV